MHYLGDRMKEHEGVWWPDFDVEGRRSDYATIDLIDKAVDYCNHRRVCIQAGGHCGLWARRLAQLFDWVITLEPDSDNLACLLRNIPGNVEPIWAALGSSPGFTGLEIFPKNTGANYMDGPGDIPVITIDSIGFPYCDLLILDIEGMEAEALKGAVKTLERLKPVLLIEDKGLSERYGTQKGWSETIGNYHMVYRGHRDNILVHADFKRS